MRDEVFEFPATPTQRALWFVHSANPQGTAYNIPMGFRLRGPLDVESLRAAFQDLLDRHEIFRAVFREQHGELLLRVHSVAQLDWQSAAIDVSDADGVTLEALRARRASEHASELFDLERGPLLRVRLDRYGPEDADLVVVMHHIVIDHLSLRQCAQEVAEFYRARRSGTGTQLDSPELQFGDFSVWLRENTDLAERERKVAAWRHRLDGYSGVLDLPTDLPRTNAEQGHGAELRFKVAAPLAQQVRQFARTERVSLYLVTLSALKVLLHRLSDQPDIIVGTPFANRAGQEALERVVGCFINTLPIATRFDKVSSFRTLLQEVKAAMLEAVEMQDVPLDSIVDAVKPRREPGRNPLFQVGFVLQEPPIPLELDGLAVEDIQVHSGGAMYDLHFWLWDEPDAIGGVAWFDTALYTPAGIEHLIDAYHHLLGQLIAHPEASFDQLSLIPPTHAQKLAAWNATEEARDAQVTVLSLFRAQCLRTPDATAISSSSGHCSYAELDTRSEALARYLSSRGACRGSLVGLCLERSIDMVIAQLAILKTGAAYVPLDPSYPVDRLAYMAEDAALALLVTHSELASTFEWPRDKTVLIDADAIHAGAAESSLRAEPQHADPAYVIYTSGSTGKPKGVVVPHGPLANFLLSMAREPGLAANDTLLAVTTLSFDIAVLELLLPLTVGAQIVLASKDETVDGNALCALLERRNVTVMQATPSTWRLLLDTRWRASASGFKGLVGGEGLPLDLARELLALGVELWNMYGPTETTVWSTCWKVDPSAQAISIGLPIANTQIHVLDDHQRQLPIGMPGEIYIAGDGVTLGYLNREALTAERFVLDPFANSRARMYRTGDRGRWRHDGLLEHLGRLDSQVKIRGYRIEPGEIEIALARHDAIARAVVIVREVRPGDARLVAYVVPATDAAVPPPAELRAFLALSLPDYMLPQHVVPIDEVPLLPNGKIDRRSLPAPDANTDDAAREEAVTPQGATEVALLPLWRDALGRDSISVTDDFFAIGGHSMLAMRLVGAIDDALGRRIPLSALLEAPTIRKLAAWIDREAVRDSLITIRTGGSRPPLFLVHDGEGETLLYRTLALGLRSGHAVYGLQPHAADGHAMLHTRVSDMAAYHVQKIRGAQPVGPYLIGGLCAGGVIAYEVVRQLESQGQRVALLALLDVADVGTPIRGGRKYGKRLTSFLGALGESPAGHPQRRWRDRLSTASGKVTNLLRYEITSRLQASRTRRDVLALRRHVDASKPIPAELRRLSVHDIYMFARDQHRSVGHVQAHVALFRATDWLGDEADEPVTHIHDDPLLGWSAHTGDNLKAFDVPGGHVTMLQEPHVGTLARLLQQQIDTALSAPSTRHAAAPDVPSTLAAHTMSS